MKHVLILDTDCSVEHLGSLSDRTFVSVSGKCPPKVIEALNVQTADSLQEAVANATELTIATGSTQWDDLLLGADGILTAILEGTQITYDVDLDDEKRDVYTAFLASKNLALLPLSA